MELRPDHSVARRRKSSENIRRVSPDPRRSPRLDSNSPLGGILDSPRVSDTESSKSSDDITQTACKSRASSLESGEMSSCLSLDLVESPVPSPIKVDDWIGGEDSCLKPSAPSSSTIGSRTSMRVSKIYGDIPVVGSFILSKHRSQAPKGFLSKPGENLLNRAFLYFSDAPQPTQSSHSDYYHSDLSTTFQSWHSHSSQSSREHSYSGFNQPIPALPWLISVFAFCFIFFGAHCFMHIDSSADGVHCRMPYMTPTYQPLTGFNSSHTRFASKYHLLLYREDGIDEPELDSLTGVPVIFIPGNAGSFRQVRSLAAECSHQYDDILANIPQDELPGHLDFFTADFGEDLTAFHGQTLMDQAEYLNDAISYILDIYHDNAVKTGQRLAYIPRSVILIGHSMGGMVARTMLMIPNYRPGSVITIITLAAPHSLPPLAFDWDLVKLYEEVNKYWEDSFSQELMGRNPLAHVSLISIAGGKLDQMIPPEHTSVSSMVPDTNGFTVFTSTIPEVWTGVDHQAIVWCDQLRVVLASTLLSITDIHNQSRMKSLADRMSIFRYKLLTGLEEPPKHQHQRQQKALVATSSHTGSMKAIDTMLLSGGTSAHIIPEGKQLRLTDLGSDEHSPMMHLFPLELESGHANTSEFLLLTDQTVIKTGEDPSDRSGIYVFACRYPFSTSSYDGSSFYKSISDTVTVTGAPKDANTNIPGNLVCHNLAEDFVTLPRAADFWADTQSPESHHGKSALAFLHHDLHNLNYYDFIAVVETSSSQKNSGSFVLGSIEPSKRVNMKVTQSLWRTLPNRPLVAHLPNNRSVMVDVSFDNVWSSLLAFTAQFGVKGKSIRSSNNQVMTPIIRQYMEELHESRFHVNVVPGTVTNVSVHGVAPFSPFTMKGDQKYNNLHFQVWSDAQSEDMVIRLKLDYMATVGRIVLHYRVVMAVFPLGIVFLVIMIQFNIHGITGKFVSFSEGMRIFFAKYLPYLLIFACLVPYAIDTELIRNLLYFIELSLDPNNGEGRTNAFADTKKNRFFLGLESSHMWVLGPIFILVTSGTCLVCYYLFTMLVHGFSRVIATIRRRIDGPDDVESTERTRLFLIGGGYGNHRRVVVILFLLFAVAFFIPYQFAVLVVCFVLFMAAVNICYQRERLIDTQNSPTGSEEKSSRAGAETCDSFDKSLFMMTNFYNYVMTVFMLIFWILPANIPVLIVWIHNLSVRWTMVFHSHHNLFAIIPILLLVERVASGQMIPRMNWFSQQLFTKLMLLYCAMYCLIFGLQRAYWLHHLVNFFASWLIMTYWEKYLPKSLLVVQRKSQLHRREIVR